MHRTCLAAVTLLALATPADAQPPWTHRIRFTAEAEGAQTNPSSPRGAADGARWRGSQLLLASADAAWEPGPRVRLGGGAIAIGSSATSSVTFDVREAYIRVSAAAWTDVEVGKRLIRWGVGYGFSPTGVLDPPRVASDPTDRLGRNEGMPIARVDLFSGNSSLTVAAAAPGSWRRQGTMAPDRLAAARLRTVLPGGLEIAIIGSAAPGVRTAVGGNVTHVIGDRLEWHGELIVHDAGARRAASGVAGLQYTFVAGVNLIVEYHRHGSGLTDEEWDLVRRGARAPAVAPTRRNALFARAARAGADVRLAPELIVIHGLDDGSWTVAAAVTWTASQRWAVHARVVHLAGPRASLSGVAPVSTALTSGVTLRF